MLSNPPRAPQPTIALVGPWIENKGDALMLQAVLEHFRDLRLGAPPELWPAGVPDMLSPISRRPSLRDLGQALRGGKLGRAARLAGKGAVLSLPRGLAARATRRVGAHQVTRLLDCSGFGYGDQWTTPRMHRRRAYYAHLRRQGARIALLPQALGPFEVPEMRKAARELIGLCDVAWARDGDSFAYLQGLGLDVEIGQAPDITHLLDGHPPSDADAWRRRVCIVPNTRMIDRTSPERAAAYREFLSDAINEARAAGLEPWLVLHEANDGPLVAAINEALEAPLPVTDPDALATKGILGSCRAVIGSRYHALVSALSQATPTLGTSWSHKYDRLFEEYGHGDFLVPPEAAPDERRARMRAVLAADEAMTGRLKAAAARQRRAVEEMWRRVDAVR